MDRIYFLLDSVRREKGKAMSEKQDFKIGDCIIINEFDKPSAYMLAVIVGKNFDYFQVAYLNADPRFDEYCSPSMENKLDRATKIETFGVELMSAAGKYWVERITPSQAKYPDGKTRIWQESCPMRYSIRKSVAKHVETLLGCELDAEPEVLNENQRAAIRQQQSISNVIKILAHERDRPLLWSEKIDELYADAKIILASIQNYIDHSITG
jgi:hypothetical protein